MGFVTWIVLVWLLVSALAYHRATLKLWTLTIGIAFVILTFWVDISTVSTLLLWLLYLGIFIPLNTPELRRSYFSDRLLAIFKQQMPPMSQTEKDAIDAGNVWWDEDLFSGNPDWNRLLHFIEPKLTSEEQAFLDGPTEELCALIDDWQVTEELHDMPDEVWAFMKQHGFFGMIIPKEYGGKDFSALAHSAVVMKLSSRSISSAVTVMVPNSLGPAKLLLHYGTEEQKDHYLPKLATGEEIPCFALTSPDAGSDAASMTDYGIVCREDFDGESGVLGIRLNWEKRYITLGPVATVLGLAFKLYDPEHLIGEKESLGITLALIPTDTPGIDIGSRHYPLNMVFQNGPNRGKDVFIPMEWVIGDQQRIGDGWRMLMECLADGRAISLPALSTGGGKLACRGIGAYARIRKQFKTPIGKFEGIEEALARIAGNTYAMDSARIMTLGALDDGEKPSVISAIVKYHLTERMRSAVNDAMDIQGGAGICMGPKNILARVYQGIPISITVEGANILTRSLIIFGQGAVRAHPFVLKEMQAIQDEDIERGSILFDETLFTHMGYVISNATRSFLLGITGARLARVPIQDVARKYSQHLTRMSAAFALLADVSMAVLGSALKRKERMSSRLGDILSQMYIASSTIKHFHDQGKQSRDEDLLRWVCEDSLFQCQVAIDEILQNFPNKVIAAILSFLIFPLGKHYKAPSDRLCKQVASLLLEPNDARDRLTRGIYVPKTMDQTLGRYEDALVKVIAAEPIERTISQRMKRGNTAVNFDPREDRLDRLVSEGVINEGEAITVRKAMEARRECIMVDEFPQDFWKKD